MKYGSRIRGIPGLKLQVFFMDIDVVNIRICIIFVEHASSQFFPGEVQLGSLLSESKSGDQL